MQNMWIEQKMYQEYKEFNEGFLDGEIRASLGLGYPDEGVDFYSRGSLEGYKLLTLGLINYLLFDGKKFEIYFEDPFIKMF